MTRLFLFILTVLYVSQGLAQTYSGNVTDTDAKPLENVSVIMIGDKGRNITFAKTDRNGVFTVKTPEGKKAVALQFVRVGYAKMKVDLSGFKQGQTVEMTDRPVEIKEVTVTPEKMWQKGDTLVYSVQGFRERYDRTIEDVISHMPGLKIGPNGEITFKDKPINKFYVEGQDVTGDKYAMVSKNLSADKVKHVEVLQNHQPVKALRGNTFSENAALNLVLTDNAKEVWTGTVALGNGATLQNKAEWLRDSRLTGMFFGKQMQNVSIYKCNNTGADIEKEIMQTNGIAGMTHGLLGNIATSSPGVKGCRADFNDSHIAATNWLFKTGDDSSLRLQMSAFYKKNESEGRVIKQYADIEPGEFVEETSCVQAYSRQWDGSIAYSRNSSTGLLSYKLHGCMDFDESYASTLLNGSNMQQHVRPRSYSVGNDLMFLRRAGANNFFLNMNVGYAYLPGTLLLYNGTEEQLDMKSATGNLKVRYSRSIGNLSLGIGTGISLDMKQEYVAYSDTTGSIRYREVSPFIEPIISYNSDKLHVAFQTKLSADVQHMGDEHKKRFPAEPHFSLDWNINKHFKASMSYRYDVSPASFYSSTPLRVYTTYNMAISGSGSLEECSSSHSADARLEYTDFYTGISSAISYSYARNNSSYMYSSTLDDGIYKREMTKENNSTNSNSVRMFFEKSFRKKGHNIAADFRYGWSNYDIISGGKKTGCDFRSYGAVLSWTFRLFGMVSVKGMTDYSGAMYKNASTGKTDKDNYFSHDLSVIFASGPWTLKMNNNCSHGSDESTSFSLFSDAFLSYRTKGYEIELNCNNLWGKDTIRRYYITNYASTYYTYKIRPREVVAKIIFNF